MNMHASRAVAGLPRKIAQVQKPLGLDCFVCACYVSCMNGLLPSPWPLCGSSVVLSSSRCPVRIIVKDLNLALLSKIGDGDCTGLSSRNIQQLVSPRNIGHRSRTAPNPQAQIAGRWTSQAETGHVISQIPPFVDRDFRGPGRASPRLNSRSLKFRSPYPL